MTIGRISGAVIAQVMAQALTGWTLAFHLVRATEWSPLVIIWLVAAGVVPFRHDGSLRNRAMSNFGAGLVMASFLWWEVLVGGFDYVFGDGGSPFGMEFVFILVATVLFTLSGAMFWTMREGRED